MLKIALLTFVIFTLSIGNLNANPVDSLTFYTEDAPPLNFKDGEITGITVDILAEIFKRTGSSTSVNDVKIVPWARGYDALVSGPNTILFATAKTKDRTDSFKWVGPITDLNIVVLTKKDGPKINSASDLMPLKIASVLNDVGEQLLLSETGYPEASLKRSSLESAIKKLSVGRVDALTFVELTARYRIGQLGLKQADYIVGHELLNLELFYAASKDVSDETIAMMQKALDSIRADGTLDKIISKYL